MESVNIKIPNSIINKIRLNAPTYPIEDSIRGTTEYGQGYKSICIYVQNGLSDKIDLFKIIAKAIFTIQLSNARKYPLVVFGFGRTIHLQHDKKYSFITDHSVNNVAKAISNISGSELCYSTIIPELFPKTDIRSLYYGKTRIEREDLLIIIGRENEVFINETFKDKITDKFKKQILLVEIGKKDVSFKTRVINFEFKTINDILKNNPMSNSATNFKRNFSINQINKLQAKPFYRVLQPEIISQLIFPAIRNNYIDFYFKGGRLFKYDDKGFQTHIKYAAVIEKDKNDYLTEEQLEGYKFATDFSKNYKRIKENCANYAGIEACGVSEIYHRHSYVGRDKGIVVLDIEVSLKSLDPDNKQDRIDILLFNADEKKLKFVEAKHYSNSEIWSKKEARVISQIKRYETQIKSKKSEIIAEYNKYIDIANSMFSGKLPYVDDIAEKLTLLIFGFDNDQKRGRMKTLITDKKSTNFKGITIYPVGNVNIIKLENLWKVK
jgi:hypothetical protein